GGIRHATATPQAARTGTARSGAGAGERPVRPPDEDDPMKQREGTAPDVESAAPSRFGIEEIERLFRDAPAAVAWLAGPRHEFRFANEAYLRMVGRRDLVGRTV